MAFTTMHFAFGMAGAGALASVGALLLRRGWRWVPMAMTAGGIWACVPDFPRVFKEDFPNLPYAQQLSSKPLAQWLDDQGNWFFLHRMLDEQPKEFALHGLLGILTLYTLSVFLLALALRRRDKAIKHPAQTPADSDAAPTDSAEDQLQRAA